LVGKCGLDASGSAQGLVAGSCEHGNEPSDYIKGGELLKLTKAELCYCHTCGSGYIPCCSIICVDGLH